MTKFSIVQNLSRRTFLKTSAAFALAPAAFGNTQSSSANGKLKVYAGTYTSAVDGSANGEGIYLFEMNARSGEFSEPRLVAKTPNPSWLSIHPSKKFLYAINEVNNYEGNSGSVTAFAIDPDSGNLTAINTVSSQGAGPAHMSLDAGGKFVFVANYAGGTIAVLPIRVDGSLGEAVDVHRDTESLGARHAATATRGSFAISGHDKPHAHMIAADPSGKFVLATDLAQDRIYVYRFDAASGKLTPAETPFASLPTGDGPRHFAFHPNGRWLYLVEEEASVVVFFHFNPATGALEAQQTLSALPAGFAGTNFGSEIAISHDGKFLHSANRLHDSISTFAIGADGKLTYVGEASTMGDYPRFFCFDPSGKFVYACDQRSDSIATFAVSPTTGKLSFTGRYTPVPSPAMLAFLS